MTHRKPDQASELVREAMAPLEDQDLPEMLTSTIARYQQHLVELATSMLEGGHDQATVRHTLETVFGSYRDELAAVIMKLKESRHET